MTPTETPKRMLKVELPSADDDSRPLDTIQAALRKGLDIPVEEGLVTGSAFTVTEGQEERKESGRTAVELAATFLTSNGQVEMNEGKLVVTLEQVRKALAAINATILD